MRSSNTMTFHPQSSFHDTCYEQTPYVGLGAGGTKPVLALYNVHCSHVASSIFPTSRALFLNLKQPSPQYCQGKGNETMLKHVYKGRYAF